MAIDLKRTNVVIVGLGAVGGVAALPLTRAGFDVIGLEAGSWLTPSDFAPDELRNEYRGWPQAVQKANNEVPTARPNRSAPYSPRSRLHPMMNAVGGTSLHYWAMSWRLNPWDFKVVSETTRRYGASRIPKGSTVEDWPFGLEELEPYYDRVEHEVGVSGQAGNIDGVIDPRGNVFEGPRKRGYPMSPLRASEFTALMANAARKLGWHPFPGPAAINSQEYDDRPACQYHGFCAQGGCHVSAKNSTAVSTIPKAMETKRLEVVPLAIATSIVCDDRSDRVIGVIYVKGGVEYFQPADVVLLASYTYENVRQLLLSKSGRFPNGLSNNGGQVGRHYFSHLQGFVSALFPFNLNNWYGLPAQGVAVDTWADDNFDHSGLDFIGGGSLWVYSDRRPIGAASMLTFGKAPSWGTKWKSFIRQNADRANEAHLQLSTLPHEENYLDLDPDVKDPMGFPVIRITGEYKENDKRLYAFIQDKMVQWFTEAGAIAIEKGDPIGSMVPTPHAYGGTRMGDNPKTNVVNRWGFSHEVPNLGILGASVMGTSGSRNPTLTAQALAWRTAEHLAANWKSIADH